LEARILDVGPARLRHAQAVQLDEHRKRGVGAIEALGIEEEGAKFAAIHAVASLGCTFGRRTYWARFDGMRPSMCANR
jgi:hypothetical protein